MTSPCLAVPDSIRPAIVAMRGGPAGHGQSVPADRRPCHTRRHVGAITHVGVVGAGTMGNGIAQAFAQSGITVTLVDASNPR